MSQIYSGLKFDSWANALRKAVKIWRRFDCIAVRRFESIIDDLQIDIVVDVGAREGQFGSFLRKYVGYDGKIVSFEPARLKFQCLLDNSQGDSGWICYHRNVSSRDKSLENKNNLEESRSKSELLRKISPVRLKETAEVVRLDTALYQLPGNILLRLYKFDVEVVESAAGIMDRVLALQTEGAMLICDLPASRR